MRIWMVLTVLAPLGGIEAALVPLSLELKAQGHEVIVYTVQPLSQPNQNAAAMGAAGIRVITSPAWLHALLQAGVDHQAGLISWLCWLALPALAFVAVADAWRRGRPFQRALRGAVGKLSGGLAAALDFESWSFLPLGRGLRQAPADVVHVHGWGCGQDPPGAMRWLRRRAYPVLYTEHNSPDPARLSSIEAAPINLADALIAVSQAGAQGLRTVCRATSPLTVIPYGVSALPTVPAEPHGAFTLTCFARLHPQKGQMVLLEALAQMLARAPDVLLLLAGDGPTRRDLETRVTQLGLEKHVRFLGIVSRGELPELLARTDVVVLPSFWEGLPVSLIEALSAGKAIVASRVGGNPELVTDGLNGLLVPPGDVPSLARALLGLASDPDRVQRMGLASRERFAAGGFAPSVVAAQHLAAYRRAIAGHDSARALALGGADLD